PGTPREKGRVHPAATAGRAGGGRQRGGVAALRRGVVHHRCGAAGLRRSVTTTDGGAVMAGRPESAGSDRGWHGACPTSPPPVLHRPAMRRRAGCVSTGFPHPTLADIVST